MFFLLAYESVTLVFLNAQADAVLNTRVVIINSPPTIVSVVTSDDPFGAEDYPDGIINSLVPAGERPIYVSGIVEDVNSRLTITNVRATAYRSGVYGGSGCSPNDANDCYVTDGCDLQIDGTVTDVQQRYTCLVPFKYFTDGTMYGGEFPDEHWVVSVQAFDDQGGISDPLATDREIQTLLAVNFPLTIDYGVLAPGDSTDEWSRVSQTISQAGNDVADVEVSYQTYSAAPYFGGTMDCVHTGGMGAIPNENQQWSVVAGGYGSPGTTNLTDQPERAETAVAYRHGENPMAPLYWNIRIPESGVSGTCTGSVSISAVSH